MIYFSKNSWHYKYNNLVKNGPEYFANATICKSLCSYFWFTIWNILMGLVTLFLILILLYFIGAVPLLAVNPELVETFQWWVPLVGVLHFGLWIVFIVVCVMLQSKYQVYKESKYSLEGDEQESRPNLWIEWLKSQKEKICPMIGFKEE